MSDHQIGSENKDHEQMPAPAVWTLIFQFLMEFRQQDEQNTSILTQMKNWAQDHAQIQENFNVITQMLTPDENDNLTLSGDFQLCHYLWHTDDINVLSNIWENCNMYNMMVLRAIELDQELPILDKVLAEAEKSSFWVYEHMVVAFWRRLANMASTPKTLAKICSYIELSDVFLQSLDHVAYISALAGNGMIRVLESFTYPKRVSHKTMVLTESLAKGMIDRSNHKELERLIAQFSVPPTSVSTSGKDVRLLECYQTRTMGKILAHCCDAKNGEPDDGIIDLLLSHCPVTVYGFAKMCSTMAKQSPVPHKMFLRAFDRFDLKSVPDKNLGKRELQELAVEAMTFHSKYNYDSDVKQCRNKEELLEMILDLESVSVVQAMLDKTLKTMGRAPETALRAPETALRAGGTKLLVSSCALPLVRGNVVLLTELQEVLTSDEWCCLLMEILVKLQQHYIQFGTWRDLFSRKYILSEKKIGSAQKHTIHQMVSLSEVEFKKGTVFWQRCISVLEESAQKKMNEDDKWTQINGEDPWNRSPETIHRFTHGFLNRFRKTFW
jgi:hypothetical protein